MKSRCAKYGTKIMIFLLYAKTRHFILFFSSFFLVATVWGQEDKDVTETKVSSKKQAKDTSPRKIISQNKKRTVFEDKKGQRRTEFIFKESKETPKPLKVSQTAPESSPAEPAKAEPEPAKRAPPAEPAKVEPKPEPAKKVPPAAPAKAEPEPAKKIPQAEDNATAVAEGNATAPVVPFLPSDFFAGALQAAGESDAMGTQRLVDVKSGRLTPALAFSMGYNYTSNPMKVGKDSAGYQPDGFTALLNLTFNMGLGEYGVGDDVLLTPSLSLMHMRTYTDPGKDHGDQMEDFDVDVQIASVILPIILPDDYTLSLGHAYVRPISFHADNVISYSNSPNLALTKTLPLASGDILSLTAGTSYAFSNGDTLEQQIADAEYYNFIEAVMGGAANVLAQQPVNAQDAWTHTLNFTYIKPIGEQITLTPSATLSRMEFTEGANNGRDDTTYLLGVLASYMISEWMNVSASTNYMWKRSSISDLDFEDFLGGVTMGFNYSF